MIFFPYGISEFFLYHFKIELSVIHLQLQKVFTGKITTTKIRND